MVSGRGGIGCGLVTLIDMSKVFTLDWAQNHTVVPSMVSIVPANNIDGEGVTNTALIVITMPGRVVSEGQVDQMTEEELTEDIQSRSFSFLVPMTSLMKMVADVRKWPVEKTGVAWEEGS